MAELRNGASPTSSQIIIYYAQKMYAYGAFYQHLKNININIILGTWQIDWNKVRKRRDNSN